MRIVGLGYTSSSGSSSGSSSSSSSNHCHHHHHHHRNHSRPKSFLSHLIGRITSEGVDAYLYITSFVRLFYALSILQ